MEAKDTVMSENEMESVQNDYCLCQYCMVAKKQAEISFKAGLAVGHKQRYDIGVLDGKVEGIAEGIREVVEFIERNGLRNKTIKWWLSILEEEWQAFKKERGL